MTGIYFEDFAAGVVIQHARGKTMGEAEVSGLSLRVLNSAEAHFNRDRMAATPFGNRICFGAINVSVVVGLTTCDTAGPGAQEVGIDQVRLAAPVVEGDTLYAFTEVIDTQPENQETGLVRFLHWGVNQKGVIICSLERTVRLKRRHS